MFIQKCVARVFLPGNLNNGAHNISPHKIVFLGTGIFVILPGVFNRDHVNYYWANFFSPGIFPYLISLLLAFAPLAKPLFAQQLREVDSGQRERLMEISDSLSKDFHDVHTRSLEEARQMGLEIRFTTNEGVRYALQRIEDGLPYYYRTLNLGGAITSGAADLHQGGDSRLLLGGKGLTAGLWDAGSIYDHKEFEGRFVNRNPATEVDNHATHVAGSIIARGFNENARGMAYGARLRTYDWNSDLSEMASEAAAGMLLSNHSYGTSLGWTRRDGEWVWMGAADADEDYRFGFYSNLSRALDEVAHAAPYYLPVWAAGNDRSDTGDGSRPPDGPYDTVGPEGTAKNLLAVGAVNGIPDGYSKPGDVVMTAFSSWGPTDDGRIKPDLVTKGRLVFSTSLDDQYRSTSGTSMASPIVTGSLLLVQELYNDMTEGEFLRAASLKGLAIHTANAAGSGPAPDYKFGWGLLDVGRMSDFLIHLDGDRLFFLESTLDNNQQTVIDFSSDGTGPLVATLSWTDLPGSPVAPRLNPRNLMLVNDLDMRIVYRDGEVYHPWILDPEEPVAPAGTGDNFRDNVEKIYIETPPPGTFQLVITHKGTLEGGSQDFSLFLQSGPLPTKRNFFWIGGDGRWSRGLNWSLSSGGAPVDMIPGPDDHVVLDQNSFSSEDQALVLDQDAACYTLTITENALGRIDFAGHHLRLSGSLLAEKTFVREGSSGSMVFNGHMKNGYILVRETEEVPDSHLEYVFDQSDGKWRIMSDLSAGKIVIRKGELELQDINLSVKELIVETNPFPKRLDLGASVISDLEIVRFPSRDFAFMGTESTLVFGTQGPEEKALSRFFTGGVQLESIVNHADLELVGPLSAMHFLNNGPLLVSANLDVEELSFTEEAGFILGEDAGLYVGEAFSGSGSPDAIVPFIGLGRGSYIYGKTNRKFCLDYVAVLNLPAIGDGIFNAGPNGTVQQSEGWYQMDCEDVIFADFSVKSPCASSWTSFHDESSGQVDSWEWRLGDLGSSGEPSPVVTFPESGNQLVRLTVSGGVNAHSSEKLVQIIENPFPEPQVIKSGSTYFVDVTAESYQWFRNGDPIEGAIFHSYTNSAADPGVYMVLVSDGNCNRPSKNEITVSAGGPDLPDNALRVFPNPSFSSIQIEAAHEMKELEVMDLTGRVILVEKPGSPRFELDVSGLRPGIYLLRVLEGERVIQLKIQVL